MSSASRKRKYRAARFPVAVAFQPPRKYTRFVAPRQMGRIGYASVARTRGAAVTGEMKQFDCEQSVAIAATTTTWVPGTLVDPSTTINLGSAAVANPLCLFAPTVGSALNQRIGRQVKMMKVKVNGFLQVPVQATQAAADAATKVRIILVMDKQSNAGQMTSAQLQRDAGSAGTTVCSFQNPDNFGRFKVLKDKTLFLSNMNLAGSPTAGDVVQAGFNLPFKFSYRFKKPVDVHFNATNGGTVADIVDNSLHMICGANAISYAPSITYYSRVSYKE